MIEEGVGRSAETRGHGVWIPARVRCAHLAGTTRGRFVLLGRKTSLHLFVGVDAPQPLLFDPAIEAVAGDTAPARAARGRVASRPWKPLPVTRHQPAAHRLTWATTPACSRAETALA